MSEAGPSPSPDPMKRRGVGRLAIVTIAAVLSVGGLVFAVIAAGETDPRAPVFSLLPGERRYWSPGEVREGDRMRCHGEVYPLWYGGPDASRDLGGGVMVAHVRDGSFIATCPRKLLET
jgi:hypothetical protein